MASVFDSEYKKLNKAQREAVEALEGPVMVIAGPGTGKTQVLALRIANILQKTDIKADGILCLTFTNSAVEAMKERLVRYIGEAGDKVNIFTFHSFGMKIIGDYFVTLKLKEMPKLLEDTEIVIFFDKILQENDWEYLRPRGDNARYFSDLRSLISLLARERITAEDLMSAIEKEIKYLENSEDSISTRGESKGQIKKEVSKKIESLEQTKEIVRFIKIYEEAKKRENVFDYDDVLENLVRIVENSEDALAEIREKYLYILIDEHQDSSRVQNEFLSRVWGGLERPDIFVVGDDRQLIYGFSGASIDHFKGFKKTFPDAKLIPLLQNYRSTQIILDVAHLVLQSVLSNEKLVSQSKEHHPIHLVETDNAEEEIIAAGMDIKEKIKGDLDINNCAILVPKNRQVRSAFEILHNLGLPVSTGEALNFFDQVETQMFLRVLKIVNNGDSPSLALSFLDPISGISPLEAHTFLAGQNMRNFSFANFLENKSQKLFNKNPIENWVGKLLEWHSKQNDLKSLIEIIGKELFEEEDSKKLVTGEEITNTMLALLSKEMEKPARPDSRSGGNPDLKLPEFISFLEKLESYGEDIPLLTSPKEGIKVLTMHSSKGLEFEYVWIAHMDEKSLTSGKKMSFTIPESIKEKIEERDIEAVKRKLFVAITRAKKFCTISYALESAKGTEQEIARVIADLPQEIFQKKKAKVENKKENKTGSLGSLVKLVSKKYKDRYVSVSMLNNFFECPWKWYFRNLLQIPEPTNENLEFGSVVHNALDKILKMDHKPSTKELENLIQDKEVLKIISKWVGNRLQQISIKRENEQSISASDEKFPHLKIYGKIDLIERLDRDNVRVTDFKTGNVRKKSEIEKKDEEGRMTSHLRQLAMYSYLITQSPKWKVYVRESRLEFLEAENESFYDHVVSREEIDLLVQDIKDYDNLVKGGEWVNRVCHYNSYGKNTECEYCKMAEIYK